MWKVLLRRIKNFLQIAQLIRTTILSVKCLVCFCEFQTISSIVFGQSITSMSFFNQFQNCLGNLRAFFAFKIKFHFFVFFEFEIVEILIQISQSSVNVAVLESQDFILARCRLLV